MKFVKKFAILLSPLLLFLILAVPYNWANQKFIVDWLGCGCPITDGMGNLVENRFSANDFTRIFWLAVTACVTVISAFLAKKSLKEKKWHRVLYVVVMLCASLLITYQFCQMMMWT